MGISLNDVLMQGPDLFNFLVGVLICFREEHVALFADIEAMFGIGRYWSYFAYYRQLCYVDRDIFLNCDEGYLLKSKVLQPY